MDAMEIELAVNERPTVEWKKTHFVKSLRFRVSPNVHVIWHWSRQTIWFRLEALFEIIHYQSENLVICIQ